MSLVLILKMESTPNSVKDLTLVELKNGRRACKSIKHAIVGGDKGFLIASDMMFASSCMDGKFKLLSAPVLRDLKPSQSSCKIIKAPGTNIAEDHFVELDCGVGDSASFTIGNSDYILTGLEDGSLHIYNLSKNFGKSFSRPIAKKGEKAHQLTNIYD
jgi:hypothetical protein